MGLDLHDYRLQSSRGAFERGPGPKRRSRRAASREEGDRTNTVRTTLRDMALVASPDKIKMKTKAKKNSNRVGHKTSLPPYSPDHLAGLRHEPRPHRKIIRRCPALQHRIPPFKWRACIIRYTITPTGLARPSRHLPVIGSPRKATRGEVGEAHPVPDRTLGRLFERHDIASRWPQKPGNSLG
jgi:hypothetical protein